MQKNIQFHSFLESLKTPENTKTIDSVKKGFDLMGGFHTDDADALDDPELTEYYLQKKEKDTNKK